MGVAPNHPSLQVMDDHGLVLKSMVLGEPPFFGKPPYNVGHPIIINHDVMGKNRGNPRTQFDMMAQFHCFLEINGTMIAKPSPSHRGELLKLGMPLAMG